MVAVSAILGACGPNGDEDEGGPSARRGLAPALSQDDSGSPGLDAPSASKDSALESAAPSEQLDEVDSSGSDDFGPEAQGAEDAPPPSSDLGYGDEVWVEDRILLRDGGSYRLYTREGALLGETELDTDCPLVLSPGTEAPLATVEATDLPAQGLESERIRYELVLFDNTLAEVDRLALATKEPELFGGGCGEEHFLEFTTDARAITLNTFDIGGLVVDLATRTVNPTDDRTPVAFGRNVALYDGFCANCLNGLKTLPIVDPTTLQVLQEYTGDPDDESTPLGRLKDAEMAPVTWLEDGETMLMVDAGLVSIFNVVTGTLENLKVGGVRMGGHVLVDEDNGTFTVGLVNNPYNGFGGVRSLRQYDLATSAEMWQESRAEELCAAHDGQVVVAANDQLVTLSATTGEQLGFSADLAVCPTSHEGIGVAEQDTWSLVGLTNWE